MNKKWIRSSVSMVMAALVVASGAAALTTSAVDMGNVTVSAASVHEFTIDKFLAENPDGGRMKVGSKVKFTPDLSQAQVNEYNKYTSAYITVMKDGIQHAKLNFNNGSDTWTPTESGTYTARIDVVDYYGNFGTRTTMFNVINSNSLHIEPLNVSPVYGTKLKVGNRVRFSYGSNGATLTDDFKFKSAKLVITKAGVQYADLDVNLTDEGNKNLEKWYPTEQGNYTAKLTLVDAKNNKCVRTIAFYIYNGESDVCVDSFKVSTPSGKYCVGAPIKFDYSVSNCYLNSYGTYTCAEVIIKKDGKEYKRIDVNTYVDKSNWQWVPSETGKYVAVFSMSDGLPRPRYGMSSIGFTVTERLTASATLSKSCITLGQTTTVTGAGKNGAGKYQYEFAYKKSGEYTYKRLQNFNSNAKYNFKPTEAGTYQIQIRVKDANGCTASLVKDVVVKTALKNNSKISATKVKVNKAVTVTGAASGGAGSYQYALYYKLSTDSSYKTARGFSSTKAASVTLKTAGTYTVLSRVKDANGKTTDKKFTVTVTK